MHRHVISLFILGLFVFLPIQGQKDKVRCEGTYPYHFSSSISLEQAKGAAVENAILRALEDKFGTEVTSKSQLLTTNQNGKSEQHFANISRQTVKGTKLGNIHEPRFSEPIYADGFFTINVTVAFYGRERLKASTEIDARVLRNGKGNEFEDSEFKSGDKFFMQFTAERDGYLAIFFQGVDNVQRMLPYYGEEKEAFRVEKGKTYTLFDVENNTYHMKCGAEPELNLVYVVFSPENFIHDDVQDVMNIKKFEKKLAKWQEYDDNMVIDTQLIHVFPAEDE